MILERDFIQQYCNHSQRNGHLLSLRENGTIIMYMNFYLGSAFTKSEGFDRLNDEWLEFIKKKIEVKAVCSMIMML